MRTALLLGATGLVGGHCLDLLLNDSAYGKVFALGRRLTSREHPKLEQHVVASEQGARQFLLVSALGADPRSSIFYNRVKGELERAVAQLAYDAVNFFRP